MAPGIGRSQRSLFVVGTVLMAAAGGCAHYTPVLATAYRPIADRAYLYGRFAVDAESHLLAVDDHATMGFRLACADGEIYTIRFWNRPRVQVIEVKPSVCQMTEIVFTDADGGIKGRRRAPPGWMTPRKFDAGRAYYLGDYRAAVTHQAHLLSTEWRWELTSEENDYAGSTKELAASFGAFAGMPTGDKSFVSAPPKARPRRRPADVPSPSPQQIAQAAALIRRTFPTLAACEADCATGDCLPFRGPDGIAMTCIVYCRTGKECPDGFTCNALTGDGRQARGADGPEPPLTGICLAATAASN